jgi:hypothetical protein
MPLNGSATSSKKATSRQVMSMSGQLSMFELPSWPDTTSVISSLESVVGPSLSGSQDGQIIVPSGQPACPVSPSRLRRSTRKPLQKGKQTNGICCQTSCGSPRSAALQLSLANRLATQLSGAGSTKHSGAWKHLVTPAGRSLHQLLLSARDMSGSGFTGWPTPAARDGRDISRSNAFLSQRRRHSPSMATRLLERGAPWTVITAIYCLAMGFPSSWNVTRPKATATRLSRNSLRASSPQSTSSDITNADSPARVTK